MGLRVVGRLGQDGCRGYDRVVASTLEGWRSVQHAHEDGSVESRQSVRVPGAVVEETDAGAAQLGRSYWRTVEESTRHLFRISERGDGLEIRLLRRGPAALTFGRPELTAAGGRVACRYPITGGFLACRPAGAITLAQETRDVTEVSSTIEGFVPRLAARPGRPGWTGTLYQQIEVRIHVAISRRYFDRLVGSRE
jgi:hypothetical protein